MSRRTSLGLFGSAVLLLAWAAYGAPPGVGYFAVIAALGLLVLAAAVGHLQLSEGEVAERRRSSGECVGCGYDLRESPGRCPECGRGPPARP